MEQEPVFPTAEVVSEKQAQVGMQVHSANGGVGLAMRLDLASDLALLLADVDCPALRPDRAFVASEIRSHLINAVVALMPVLVNQFETGPLVESFPLEGGLTIFYQFSEN